MKTQLTVFVTGLILFLFIANASAQISDWDDVVEHAVLNYGLEGNWDDRQIWNPSVIKDGDTLRMYYTGGYEIVWDFPYTKIGYAWSLDGVNWTRYSGNPVLSAEYTWEEDYLFGCAVIRDNDTLKMWYGCGYPGKSIGYATSMDGKNWTKHPSPVLSSGPVSEWDDSFVVPTSVIKEEDHFKIWYWAGGPGWPYEESMPQSGLATSTDGINWTKYNDTTTTTAPHEFSDPVLKHGITGTWDEHRTIHPMVLKKGSGYEAWYAGATWAGLGGQHLGYAQSDDGINWVKHPEPVFTSPRSWGSTIYGGTVLNFDSNYHLWYACFQSVYNAGPEIGYAVGSIEDSVCLNDGYFFTTQSQIDNFQVNNPWCTVIGGNVEISGSDITNLDGLSELYTIDGSLNIHDNPNLINFSGLGSLASLNGDFKITSNDLVTDFTGLDNLISISGDLRISANESLTVLNGLENIDPESIIDLSIAYNEKLTYCHIDNICYYLYHAPNGSVIIKENAVGCEDSLTVRQSCPPPVSLQELMSLDKFVISPNPFSISTTIEYELSQPSKIQLTIYNHLGEHIEVIEQNQSQGKQQFFLNSEGLPAGVYFCVLKTESGMQTMKMIKLK